MYEFPYKQIVIIQVSEDLQKRLSYIGGKCFNNLQGSQLYSQNSMQSVIHKPILLVCLSAEP